MTEQITLFDDFITMCGIQIKIPHITLKEMENHYPQRYLAHYEGKPFLYFDIDDDGLESPSFDYTALDKKSGGSGAYTEDSVIWKMRRAIEREITNGAKQIIQNEV